MFERAVTSGVSALEWTHVVVASRDAICAQRQIFLLPTPWFSVDLPFFSFFHLGELSLTLLSLVFGWVNPFLSGTHAAPVHHCIAQNARVQLCSRARQQGESRQEHGLDAHEQTHTHSQHHHHALWGIWCFSGVHPGAVGKLDNGEVCCATGVEARLIWVCILHGNRNSDFSLSAALSWTSHSSLNRIFLILAIQKKKTLSVSKSATMRSVVTF